MIEQIKIDNFALIKSLELKFASGFNVLLGETGAGKSIILGALNFVLGGKADKSIIRSGEEIAKVSAVFSSTNKKVGALLESFGFESADEVLVYRSFNMQGKSEVRINGQFATVVMLRELGALLVDSYNQNEQVELTKSKNHLRILDSFRPESLKEYFVKMFVDGYKDPMKRPLIGDLKAELEKFIEIMRKSTNKNQRAICPENARRKKQ